MTPSVIIIPDPIIRAPISSRAKLLFGILFTLGCYAQKVAISHEILASILGVSRVYTQKKVMELIDARLIDVQKTKIRCVGKETNKKYTKHLSVFRVLHHRSYGLQVECKYGEQSIIEITSEGRAKEAMFQGVTSTLQLFNTRARNVNIQQKTENKKTTNENKTDNNDLTTYKWVDKSTHLRRSASGVSPADEIRSKGIHNNKNPKSYPMPRKFLPYIERYYDIIQKSFPADTNRGYAKLGLYLKRMEQGILFNKEPSLEKYHNCPFTLDQVNKALDNLEKCMKPEFLPVDKDVLKKKSMNDWLLCYYTKQKSSFLVNLFSEPVPAVAPEPDIYPAITEVFRSCFPGRKFSVIENNKLIKASIRTIDFFNSPNITPHFKVMTDAQKAAIVWRAAKHHLEDASFAITPGHLCSDKMFDERLPDYCRKQNILSETKRSRFSIRQ